MSKESPSPARELQTSLIKISAVVSACQLGLFKILAEYSLTTKGIALVLSVDETGITRLVEALVNFGYLKEMDGGYSNGQISKEWLCDPEDRGEEAHILWLGKTWDLWRDLTKRIKGEKTSSLADVLAGPEAGTIFADYMGQHSERRAKSVAEKIAILASARRMLDLGGSHGFDSIEICKRNPQLTSVVYDLPNSLVRTSENIKKAGLSNRVTTSGGDFHKDAIGCNWDVILISNILHGHSWKMNIKLLKKAFPALKDDGRLFIVDMPRETPPTIWDTTFSLNAYSIGEGRTYSTVEVEGMLVESGFDVLGKVTIRKGSPPSSLTTAVKRNKRRAGTIPKKRNQDMVNIKSTVEDVENWLSSMQGPRIQMVAGMPVMSST